MITIDAYVIASDFLALTRFKGTVEDRRRVARILARGRVTLAGLALFDSTARGMLETAAARRARARSRYDAQRG